MNLSANWTSSKLSVSCNVGRERTVTGYFDYIEDQIERKSAFTMEPFSTSVNEFLAFRKYQVLPDGDKGKVSAPMAKAKAALEYDVFNLT